MAFVIGYGYSDVKISLAVIPHQDWFYGALVLGFLFITIFNVMATTSQRNGLSVASVSGRMAVVIPIVFGILLYNESISFIKVIGILLALVAVYLTSVKSNQSKSFEGSSLLYPIILFLGSGAIDTLIKYTELNFVSTENVSIFSATIFASGTDKKHDDQNDGGRVNTKEEVEAYILHHIKDSHDFSLFSYTGDNGERHHFGFPLPIILWTSEGLVTFMSSEFHHNDDGHVVVEKKGLKFAKVHSKIYELDESASSISFDETHHPTNAHKVLDFSITKSVVGILFIGLLLLFWFSRLAKQYKTKKVPTGFARVLEPLVIYVRDEIAKPNIGEKKYRKFTGYLLTVFFFIWGLNLLGMMPFGFNATGQLAVTACLAIFNCLGEACYC